MTSTPGRGSRPIRIGNCSGFYGDRASAMADMARAGGIDVLTGDYLAEVTMLILGKARAKDSTQGLCGHLPAAPRRGARAPRRERDPARRQRRRAQPRRAGRRDPRTDRTPRLRPSRLPHRRRRRLRPPRRSAASRPLAAAPDERRTAVVLAAPAPDGQRLPGRVRHRARAGQRRRHRHHRPGRRRLAGRRSRRLVVELDPE